jgi:3-oxoadipate enol-lactonase
MNSPGQREELDAPRMIAHEERGEGLPVVLLHPFPLDRSYWSPQLGAFVDHCRCIAPDRRGFGESPAGPPYTIDSHADDVAALLDRLSIESAVIGGISMGGYVALAMWRRHPERVRGLMLFDTRAGGETDQSRLKRSEQIAFVQQKGTTALADELVPVLVGATTRERHPEKAEQVRSMIARASVQGVVDAVNAMMDRPDSIAALATITVPTLIVCGAEDVSTPPEESRLMHDRIAGSALEIIEGAGHLSSMERPAAVNHVIREFLAELIYA